MKGPSTSPIRLIINADDYGYFSSVDSGIAQLARSGSISAMGVLATASDLKLDHDFPRHVDMGVHLNLTHGSPLTSGMADLLVHRRQRFTSVFATSIAVLKGEVPISDIRKEWAAQIERVLRLGQEVHFLNSHEHIHMLPPLFGLTQELAASYGIRHVRVTAPDWLLRLGLKAQLRNAAIAGLKWWNRRCIPLAAPRCIGLGRSGRLDETYLSRLFARLHPGQTYELICHPGYRQINPPVDRAIAEFHDWEGELNTFLAPAFRTLLSRYGIAMVRYRDLALS